MSQALSYLMVNNNGNNDDEDDSDLKRYDNGLQLPVQQLRSVELNSRGNSHLGSASMRSSSVNLRKASRSGVLPPTNADVMQELNRAQLESAELSERLKQTEQEKKELSDTLRLTKQCGKGRSQLQVKKVEECAKKYALLYRPWVAKLTCDSLSMMRPEVDEKARYRNKQSQEKAHLADMRDALAANSDVKPILGLAGWLPGTFCETVSAEKCKFVHAAVGNIVDIFGSLGLTSNELGTPAARKTCNTLQAMGPQHRNDHYCLLLFPDEHPGDISWLFRTKRIVFVCHQVRYSW
ncbi:hypothetical protein BC835DRAFT_1310554 [Cytidiella melzeri]|nr:hypothetical protein BC835DRAFT_1310554 [Cytidiella melzeri]